MRRSGSLKLIACAMGLALAGCGGSTPEGETDARQPADMVAVGDSAVICRADSCDDDNPCTDDLCLADGTCQYLVLAGQTCDDGNACTAGDMCSGEGMCVGDNAVSCDDTDPCTVDTCNPDSGCEFDALPDGTACEDGTKCTTGDSCDQGVCVGGEVVKCEEEDSTGCAFKVCNAATGECDKTELVAVGAPCKDGDPCTDNDTCDDFGKCVGGGQHECVAQHPCKKSWCNEQANEGQNPCVQEWKDVGVGCDDGDMCTDQDACQWNDDQDAMKCTGTPIDCNDGNPCTSDSCNEETGCASEKVADNSPCQGISDLCSTGGKCLDGDCIGAVGNKCADENPCTDDLCSADTGECTFEYNSSDCNDEDLCTAGDTCNAGLCEGQPVTCSDELSPCLQAMCNPLSGQCDLPKVDGTACDDADLCNGAEICAAGQCLAGTPVSCGDDENPCTDDVCNPLDGSCGVVVGNGAPCGGEDPCAGGAACQDGICQPGAPVACEDDGNDCTQDVCNALDGKCGIPAENGASCGDINGWTCLASICQCEQVCDGKECGDDGCGGTCGTCDAGFACGPLGQCTCEPDCDGKDCGDNGCDGVCGECSGQNVCADGKCECQPECSDKDCGDDGCGSACGSCDDGNDCTSDSCELGTCKHEIDVNFCTNYFYDADGDKFGVDGNLKCLCEVFGKYTATKGGDCDDDDALSYPDAPEICDGGDNDCDDQKDEDFTVGEVCDGDDSDSCKNGTFSCKPDGTGVECTNEEPAGLIEVCGGGDENCNGKTDEPNAENCITHYEDKDSDTYGIEGVSQCLCGPSGSISATEPGDCDDSDEFVHPNAQEDACNGIDDNCDEVLHPDESDKDEDGVSVCDGDCDDESDVIGPDFTEMCSGKDNDCNDVIDDLHWQGMAVTSEETSEKIFDSCWNGANYAVAYLKEPNTQQLSFQRYSVSGEPIGSPKNIDGQASALELPILVATDTGYAVAWKGTLNGTQGPLIDRIDSDGTISVQPVFVGDAGPDYRPQDLEWGGSSVGVLVSHQLQQGKRVRLTIMDTNLANLSNTLLNLAPGCPFTDVPIDLMWNGASYEVLFHAHCVFNDGNKYSLAHALVTPAGVVTGPNHFDLEALTDIENARAVRVGDLYGIAAKGDPGGEVYFFTLNATTGAQSDPVVLSSGIHECWDPDISWNGSAFGVLLQCSVAYQGQHVLRFWECDLESGSCQGPVGPVSGNLASPYRSTIRWDGEAYGISWPFGGDILYERLQCIF